MSIETKLKEINLGKNQNLMSHVKEVVLEMMKENE